MKRRSKKSKKSKKRGGCVACVGAVATGAISAPIAVPIGIGAAATTYGVNKMLSKKSKTKTKTKSKTKSKTKQTGGRKKKSNSKKTKKKMKGGVIDSARYMVNKNPVKKLSSKKSSDKSSPKPVAKLFNRPEIKENYYKKAHKNRITGKPVQNPGNRSLFELDNQDILNLIGRETNAIRERKRLEEEKKREYQRIFWNTHGPSCTCDVDGPPGMGTCPECGAYNAY